ALEVGVAEAPRDLPVVVEPGDAAAHDAVGVVDRGEHPVAQHEAVPDRARVDVIADDDARIADPLEVGPLHRSGPRVGVVDRGEHSVAEHVAVLDRVGIQVRPHDRPGVVAHRGDRAMAGRGTGVGVVDGGVLPVAEQEAVIHEVRVQVYHRRRRAGVSYGITDLAHLGVAWALGIAVNGYGYGRRALSVAYGPMLRPPGIAPVSLPSR